ncbi:MAG: phosphoribosylformylglycinamidine synthase, partial [Porticoccus sp.]
MLIFRGAPALSEFRKQKLYSSLKAIEPAIEGVYAEFVHFVEVAGDLTDVELATLAALLTYGPQATAEAPEGELLLVVPRSGTISPWSSKATDIAHNAGLTSVLRLERGITYYLRGTIVKEHRQRIEALLHDRMVEAIFTDMSDAE